MRRIHHEDFGIEKIAIFTFLNTMLRPKIHLTCECAFAQLQDT
jgi:hypothetical protein